MDLNLNVLEGLKLSGDGLYLQENDFPILCRAIFEVLLKEKKAEDLLSALHSDGSVIKQSFYGLCTLVVESCRNTAEESSVSSILEDCNWSSERISIFLKQLKINQKELRINLARITSSTHPHIVDVDWKLDYNVKSNLLEKVDSFKYLISLKTQEPGSNSSIDFSCSIEDLQDLVSKLKDAVKSVEKKMNITNKHLDNIAVDHFHHLGFSTKDIALENFKDIKIVCVCGSPERVKKLAGFLNDGLKLVKAEELHNLCLTDRYVMFKIGPILLASHGIGAPSASILFHEIFKLLHYSEAKEFVFFRLGTCGGLGVKPGTIVLTKKALNGFLQPVYTQTVLGKKIDYPTIMDNTIIEELQHLVQENLNFDVISGDTFCCDDFYEAQARLDGAFCTYSKQDKEDFLTMLQSNGVKNIEMESSVVAAMCNRANIRACTMCVVLVDRLAEDQVILTNEMRKEIEKKPWYLLLEYIKRKVAPVRPDN